MNIIKFLSLFFFVLTLEANHISFTPEEAKWLNEHRTLIVSNEYDWYPYDYNQNTQAKGFIVDYMNLIASKLRINLEYKTDLWPNLLQNLNNKELDFLLLAGKTEKRMHRYVFSESILNTRYVLVTKISAKDIHSFEDLRGKKLALLEDWAISEYIRKHFKDIEFVKFKSSKEALEAVAFGLADAVLDDHITAVSIIKQNMLSNLHVRTKVELEGFDTSLHVMALKENALGIKIIDKAINSISEMELLALKSKWLESINDGFENDLAFLDEEKNYLFAKKNIKMCIDPDWMPLEKNENGKHIGMSKDYIDLLQKKMNIPIQMVPTKTWLESIEFAKERKCDIFSLAMPTPERKLYMNFTAPYLKIPLVLVTKNDEIFYSDISAISDKKIGIVEGYAYGEILRVKYPNMQLVNVANLKEGLDLVENNEHFGFIGTLATVGYSIQKNYTSELKIAGKFEENWELGIGVRNDEPLLLSVFEKAIASIPPQIHQEILNKWISVNYEKSRDYSLFFKVIGFLCFVGLFILYRQYELKKYNKKLEILSSTDNLTGLYNRMKLDEVLEYEKMHFDRYAKPFSIILLDIDDFKVINDKYGHHIGDQFLKEFATILKSNIRSSDTVGRWGGEEFLVISPQSEIEGAQKLAQKLKEKIEEFAFLHVGHKTASFGVAQIRENENIDALFDRVDKALYCSKNEGKNRVTIDL